MNLIAKFLPGQDKRRALLTTQVIPAKAGIQHDQPFPGFPRLRPRVTPGLLGYSRE